MNPGGSKHLVAHIKERNGFVTSLAMVNKKGSKIVRKGDRTREIDGGRQKQRERGWGKGGGGEREERDKETDRQTDSETERDS